MALTGALVGFVGFGCRSQVSGTHPFDGGDGPLESVPDRVVSEPYCAADAAGGGACPINFCGQLASVASTPPTGFAQSGADALCNMGRVCVVGPALATGDTFQLECIDPVARALAFGTACSTNAADGKRCAADSLCVASADFPTLPFCSALCRNDADCPSDTSGPARCIEHDTPKLPNGSVAHVGLCTPMSKIAGTACVRERDCAANEGCVSYGVRTGLRVCRKTGGTKSLGALCTGNTDCRSAQCFDRNFDLYGGQHAYCSAGCNVNSDCGPDQHCARLVVGNNGTPDNPLDDVLSGYCQTFFPPSASGSCGADGDCLARGDGSDTCDTAHGICYRAAAVPGSPCSADAQCPLGGSCSKGPRFTGGYCQTFGCSATATSGADACPGSKSVCVQRGGPDEPIAGCYEGCSAATPTCGRASEGYACAAPIAGAPPSICLSANGT